MGSSSTRSSRSCHSSLSKLPSFNNKRQTTYESLILEPEESYDHDYDDLNVTESILSDANVKVVENTSIRLLEVIGSGQFGEVYRGELDGTLVAVKRSKGGSRSSESCDSAEKLL